ncbi:bifunctional DNA primase/polymerase [Mesorhizobium sp. YM1C-6-2]|uniref:bifunctional DNA primase/polymerase n=1 Tax=Mesorhizobium sp. YM1C-6-2 TaxID=1827501 RepID=UPI000EF1E0F6|nr:bifunctional DNA primase/polymerase [Mesorhizobium sp. YM1C-6-2]RLP22149.1 hypothetical protein D8676_25825 [Mesorhizobium sp. YM1C-6-2]
MNARYAVNPPNEAADPRLPPALTSEMSRLFSAGFSLVPLGGDDGKKPTMSFRDRRRFPLATVVDRMAGSGSRSYGIRLKGLLVVDVDTDTPEARAYVERRFGTSPARTRTSRGFHLWFRHCSDRPAPVRLPGIAIDFKTGQNEFVVGPQSERPDGAVYWPEGRIATIADLPWLEDRDPGAAIADQNASVGRIPVGSRNDALKRRARKSARVASDYDNLLAELLAFRDVEMDDPRSYSEEQVVGLAKWAWQLRQQGKLWGGTNSVVVIRRSAVEELAANGHHRALSLLLFLRGQHGHDPSANFAVDPRALRKNGHFRDGTKQLYGAIKTLVARGHLVLVRPARGKRNHHDYRLGDVAERRREAERAYSYIGAQNDHPKNADSEAA